MVARPVADPSVEDQLTTRKRRVVAEEHVVCAEPLVLGEVVLDDHRVVRGDDRRPGEVGLIQPLDPLGDATIAPHDVARR